LSRAIEAKHVMSSSTYESIFDRAPRGVLSRWGAWLGTSLCACVLALLGSLPLHAAPGDRDPTFGEGGHAAFSFPGFSSSVFADASALQANGRLTIAGECQSATAKAVCVLRMTPSGALDSSFGDGGRVTTSEFGTEGFTQAIAYQDDGRLLLAGYCGSISSEGPCVVRLQANGALDTSFGVQGVVILSVATWNLGGSDVRSIQTLSDGRIALGVSCRPSDIEPRRFCAARLQSSGALDPSFGVGGVVTVEPGASLGEIQRLTTAAIDAAGRWVMAGTCSGAPLANRSFCAVRLQPNGARDLSFGANGAFVLGIADIRVADRSTVLNTDGGLVLSGTCRHVPTNQHYTCFVALTPAGQADRAFGDDGLAVLTSVGNPLTNPLVTRQTDGSLLVVGECYADETQFDFCLLRLRNDGTLDPTLPLTSDTRANNQIPISVAVDAQGRIIVSGACKSTPGESNPDQFCAARYEGGPFANTMCSFDLDGDGRVNPSVDGLILLRASLGFSANSILQGVNFPAGAKRKLWGDGGADDLRQYLVAQCGMSIAPVAAN
jgi:uncharacterized delta-60 repeat protein